MPDEQGDLRAPALRLSELLAANVEEIVAEWESRIRSRLAAKSLPRTQLRGDLPRMLERLAEGLANPAASATLDTLAQTHAVERLGAGFELRDVVVELAVLRDSILDVWQARLGSAAPASDARRLTRALDDVLFGSVTAFANARERALLAREREVEAEVRRANERLRSVLETAVDGIVTADERGIMQSVNPAMTRIFGYAQEEMLGRNVTLLMPEPYHGEHDGYMQRYLRTGEARIIGLGREVVALRKDGTVFPIELAVSEVRLPEGRLFTGLLRDITARKQVESERERLVAELQDAVRTRDDLVAIVGHDLRNPLHAIAMSAAVLVRRGDADERTAKSAARIVSSTERASRLIRDLLDFTQARIGGIHVAPQPTDAAAIARQLVEETRAADPEHEVVLQVEGDARGEWDPDRLAQVLSNLVGNAIQHGARGGPIAVRVTGHSQTVALAVHNVGKPIAPGLLAQIFEPYHRGGAAGGKGRLGLGLFIASQIVRAHRGQIRVDSSEREGTTFTVELPRTP